jgi:cholesterol oxidase
MGKACDFYGRVQGYKGLYVVDGALIPLATAAANPALTIGAFAERCMDEILKTELRG